MSFVRKWTQLEIIILNETSQTRKDNMLCLICGAWIIFIDTQTHLHVWKEDWGRERTIWRESREEEAEEDRTGESDQKYDTFERHFLYKTQYTIYCRFINIY